jgi:N6-L-threonylcarbamoyladenine synthase
MKILGIETSCDETSAAVVEDGTRVLSNVIATSAEMHAKTGGVIPEQAAREQVRSILPVISEALASAKTKPEKIDAIAVTTGPGLIGSLLVGVETAKTLSLIWKKPIIAVNHLVAHIYANWLDQEKSPTFPALALVVSGGHTDLVLMKKHGEIVWIGGTRDDAAGEAFDKCARLLGLPYPGGPAIAQSAAKFLGKTLEKFPRPILEEKNFDWSFSGLKTAVLRSVEGRKELKTDHLAAEIQEAIADVLVAKTLRAVKKFSPQYLLLAGGVAANARLREKFAEEIKKQELDVIFRVPPPKLCTDNAAYIAGCAFFLNSKIDWKDLTVNPELTIVGQI